jgi:hypothetical protein
MVPFDFWSGPLWSLIRIVKYTSEHTWPSFWLMAPSAHKRTDLMEYKGVEYTVVQMAGGAGWKWEVRFDDGKNNPV